jgi:heat shock 70kDa protein 4
MRTLQDWLYDEGEEATKAVYVSKIEDIRAVAGPIIQRYRDKVEEERQAALKAAEEAAAAKRAEAEARKAEEDAKKKAEAPAEQKDEEMTDADVVHPVEVEEPSGEKK